MPSGDQWDGRERRKDPVEDLVQHAAALAAEVAVEKVDAKGRRRRLVVQSFIAALVAAAAVSVPVVLVTAHSNRVTAHNNSAYNCDLLTQLADLSAMKAEYFEAFLLSDAHLHYAQQHFRQRQRVLTALSAIIAPKLLRELQTDSDRVDYHARRFWKLRLAPAMNRVARRTRALAKVNCDVALNGKQ